MANTETERVHKADALQRIPADCPGKRKDSKLRGISRVLWKMAPERRTEPETARLRQVPPVTAEGYLFFVPVEVSAVRRR